MLKFHINPDPEQVQQIQDGLYKNGGHCPNQTPVSPDTKCICKEFRAQLDDPAFYGPCRCGLFYKEKEN